MDIISKEKGGLLLKVTLADKVRRGFSKVRIKTKSIKVPKLKFTKTRKSVKQREEKQIPTSAIVNILIKTALEKARKEKKEKQIQGEDKSYTPKEEKPSIFGGYGTVSKTYGASPISSYVDYGKLFSYLGKFRAKSAYENLDGPVGFLNKSLESGSFVLADKEPIEKASRYIKYFLGGIELNPLAGVNPLSMVPVAGMTAAEWREYKMWMQLDSVMYLLKTRTA